MKERLRQILNSRQRKLLAVDGHKPAAVLLPLYGKDDREYQLVFTRRTETVEHHKGQISFPGGGRDRDDPSLEATAIRETHEEIGVRGEDIEILGPLDDIRTTSSRYHITPFVATIRYPYSFTMAPQETAEVLCIPLSALAAPGCYRKDLLTQGGQTLNTFFFEHQGHKIWGATAVILKQFLDLALESSIP